jgi:hypothetical protein
MDEDTITRIYCDVDDFCAVLEDNCKAPGPEKSQKTPQTG